MHLSALFIHPVKSLRGVAVTSCVVDELGLVGDRRFLIVDEAGQFLTQRTLPRMAQITAALDDRQLTLRTDTAHSIAIPLRPARPEPQRLVSVWRSKDLLADDCGDDPAKWLSSFLGTPVRLVRIGRAFHRPVLKSAARAGDVVSFADAVPFLAIGEASLAHLNDRLIERGEEPVPMDRFRPNLVISGSAPFAEDTWPRVRIGDIVLRAAGPCARCIVTTTDQHTGARTGPEPLRTLAMFRRDPQEPGKVNFGQNLIHETKTGRLHVGDAVAPIA